jgi:hypothetical protein
MKKKNERNNERNEDGELRIVKRSCSKVSLSTLRDCIIRPVVVALPADGVLCGDDCIQFASLAPSYGSVSKFLAILPTVVCGILWSDFCSPFACDRPLRGRSP